jgi:hypothetical protein
MSLGTRIARIDDLVARRGGDGGGLPAYRAHAGDDEHRDDERGGAYRQRLESEESAQHAKRLCAGLTGTHMAYDTSLYIKEHLL